MVSTMAWRRLGRWWFGAFDGASGVLTLFDYQLGVASWRFSGVGQTKAAAEEVDALLPAGCPLIGQGRHGVDLGAG